MQTINLDVFIVGLSLRLKREFASQIVTKMWQLLVWKSSSVLDDIVLTKSRDNFWCRLITALRAFHTNCSDQYKITV